MQTTCDIAVAHRPQAPSSLFSPLSWLQRLCIPRELHRLYATWQRAPRIPVWRHALRDLDVAYEADPQHLARIPTYGPVIVVANHPFGILDGAIICDIAARRRADFRVLTNPMLANLPELEGTCIPIDPLAHMRGSGTNRCGLRLAKRHLAAGGLLIVFPAGEVASLDLAQRRVRDAAWSTLPVRLARSTGCPIVPVHMSGSNSGSFHALGVIHPRLRTLRLAHELLNKVGERVSVGVGSPISGCQLEPLGDDLRRTQYLRWRVSLMAPARRLRTRPRTLNAPLPIACRGEQTVLRYEASRLPTLFADRHWRVLLSRGSQAPSFMREIGRLREATFRAVGEGTGRSLDTDAFDDAYDHIILWDETAGEVLGAYRVANVGATLARHGVSGLYTNSLFRYARSFFDATGPCFELGRSFVVQSHQRRYAALLNLWKGLARYVQAQTHAPVLVGAVSISRAYSDAARHLMARYLEQRCDIPSLARLVAPRCPAHVDAEREAPAYLPRAIPSLRALSSLVRDLEPDGKGVPVLVRHYAQLGGQYLAFNVDAQFAGALDGLVYVDLRRAPHRTLDRCAGI